MDLKLRTPLTVLERLLCHRPSQHPEAKSPSKFRILCISNVILSWSRGAHQLLWLLQSFTKGWDRTNGDLPTPHCFPPPQLQRGVGGGGNREWKPVTHWIAGKPCASPFPGSVDLPWEEAQTPYDWCSWGLPEDEATREEVLSTAFTLVTSRMDYCSLLNVGLPFKTLWGLTGAKCSHKAANRCMEMGACNHQTKTVSDSSTRLPVCS